MTRGLRPKFALPRGAGTVLVLCLGLLTAGIGTAQREGESPQVPDLPGKDRIEKSLSDLEKAQRKIEENVASVIEKATRFIESAVQGDEVEKVSDPELPVSPGDLTQERIEELEKKEPLVYLLPIEGEVRPIMMTLFKRGLEDAKQEGASLVLLEMDTPGGELFIAEEISSTLLESDVPTATWIKDKGLSAGMLIAISTQKIFMKPVISGVGDCQPIFLSTGEIRTAPEKILTEVRRYGRRAAQKNGYNPNIVNAMIDESAGFKNAECNISCASGQLLTLTAEEAVCSGFAAGLAEDLDAVLAALDLSEARIKKFEKNWAESLAAFIVSPAFSGLLSLLGLAGLFIEYKTPGFGFFGILGLSCLALVFWGHSIAHLAGYEGALLFFLGAILLAIEIFLIPGFGLVGAGGLALIIAGLILTFLQVPVDNPLFIPDIHLAVPVKVVAFSLVGAVVLILIAARYLPESRLMVGSGMTLVTELTAASGYSSHDVAKPQTLVGTWGTAVSPLKPSGIALIGNERVNVISEGAYIEAGRKVRVVRVQGARILVDSENSTA